MQQRVQPMGRALDAPSVGAALLPSEQPLMVPASVGSQRRWILTGRSRARGECSVRYSNYP